MRHALLWHLQSQQAIQWKQNTLMHIDSWCWNVFAPSTTKESGSGNGSWGQPISERVKRSMRWSPGQVTTKKRDEKRVSLTWPGEHSLFVKIVAPYSWSEASFRSRLPSLPISTSGLRIILTCDWPGQPMDGCCKVHLAAFHLGHRSGFCHGQYVATCCPTCCIDSNTEAIAKICKSRFSRLWLSVAQDSGTAHGAKHKTFPANPSSSHRSKSWSSRRHKKPLRRTCRDKRTFTTELFVAKQQCFRLCLGSTRSWWQKLTCEALI